jgi:hypothetical protein
MKNTLTQKQKYDLTKELDAFSKSPRVKTIGSSEFADEMSRELGFTCVVSNVLSCAKTIGLSLTDLFKVGPNGKGRSLYVDLYKLEQRVAELEKICNGLK